MSLKVKESAEFDAGANHILKEFILNSYLLIIPMLSIFLFLYGFFPITYSSYEKSFNQDIPRTIHNTKINIDEMYKPEIHKLVLIVIDAWRWEFFIDSRNNNAMPKINELVNNKKACIYKTRVNVPTVTMPRIKALMSGTLPNFVDIALNLGSKEILSDNLLSQAKNGGHKIIFYGDETWIKLFPNFFYRFEGTTSFYVSDFTEVDNNVTRNLDTEFLREDWSIMILHYLGLDHIGHVFGPYSPLIKPKLQEMDSVIAKIVEKFSQWSKNGEKILMVVTGDHGMKDSGGHGGATSQETLVPILTVGKSCSKANYDEEISQIDIVPTLSVLLGLPIPSSNLGSLVNNLIDDFSLQKMLYYYYYNAKQVHSQFKKLKIGEVPEFQEAVELHSRWINLNSNSSDDGMRIMNLYQSVLNDMKRKISNETLKYNIPVMTFSIIILCQVLCIALTQNSYAPLNLTKSGTVLFFNILSVFLLEKTFGSEENFTSKDVNFFTTSLGAIFLANCYILSSRSLPLKQLKNASTAQILFLLGTVLHALSFSSSSFVEEEHQTWYFYWITSISLLTFDAAKKIVFSKKKNISLKIIIMLLLLVCSHRILRKLNSTGDKYAHLPDLSDWLVTDDSKIGMTTIVVSGLLSLVLLDHLHSNNKKKLVSFFFNVLSIVFIYTRHMMNGTVLRPEFIPISKSMREVEIFWMIQIVYCMIDLWFLYKDLNRKGETCAVQQLMYLILKKWVIVSSLLHRPYNIILLPIQLITGKVISSVSKSYQIRELEIYLTIWSSNVFYFYQGNSNSLAAIDLAAGYVGLKSYNQYIVGVLLTINTYSAPILGLLMYYYNMSIQNPPLSRMAKIQNVRQYASCRLLPVTFYVITVSIQRYHLFIWSVFSPKLLYEAMHCFVLFTVMLLLQFTFLLQDYVNKKSL